MYILHVYILMCIDIYIHGIYGNRHVFSVLESVCTWQFFKYILIHIYIYICVYYVCIIIAPTYLNILFPLKATS